jgi:RNA recognition motif-containing protein
MRIFVGNLDFTITEDELRQRFAPYGEVERVQIMTDRETRQPRGFGFVEMPNATEAQAAIGGLHGTSVGGRQLTVSEAHAREGEDRPRRSRDGRRPRG